jgi:hypothetical protein
MLPKKSETYTELAKLFGFRPVDGVSDVNGAAASKLDAFLFEASMTWLTAPLTDGTSGATASADVAAPATGGASTPAALPAGGAGAAVSETTTPAAPAGLPAGGAGAVVGGAAAPSAAAAPSTGGAGAAASGAAVPAPSHPVLAGSTLQDLRRVMLGVVCEESEHACVQLLYSLDMVPLVRGLADKNIKVFGWVCALWDCGCCCVCVTLGRSCPCGLLSWL